MAQSLTSGASIGSARAACIFLHGRGQSAAQMIDDVISRIDAPDIHFVLPEAPKSAWYDARAVDGMTPATAAQLDDALSLVRTEVALAGGKLSGRPLIIAGFSQGACLAVEYLLRGGRADAAVLLTGCRVGASDDALPENLRASIPVYASNGDEDPWVPLWAWNKAREAFTRKGARVHSEIFPEREHLVCDDEIKAFSGLLTAVVEGRDMPEYST
ncbi:dienelactone hydrolase family protein [Hoeflea sp.]|uniref:alpha/beta hydrolase n=1 Tax=Hoeflea sp. TaxID=1940281 RepID=UPI0032EFC3EB